MFVCSRRLTFAAITIWGLLAATGAQAASDASSDSSVSNRATSAAVASVASAQTASIISSAATGGFSVAGSGGFSTGGTGGFSTGGTGGFSTGGTGGFNNSTGGSPTPSGTGGTGGFGAPAAPGGNTPDGGGATPTAPERGTMLNTITGHAAGSGDNPVTMWTQGLMGTVHRSETALGMNGYVYNGMVGIDQHYDDDYTYGLALGYEQTRINTSYNHGYFRSTGYTASPYFAVVLTPVWTVDGSAGYTLERAETASNYKSVTGAFDGARWFASSNITGGYAHDSWRFQPRAGVSFTRDLQGNYVDNTGGAVAGSGSNMGTLSGGGKVGYLYQGLVPYMKVLGQWDFIRPAAVLKSNGQMSEVDAGGAVVGLGMEMSQDGVTGSLEVDNNSVLRRDTDVWTLIARVRIDF